MKTALDIMTTLSCFIMVISALAMYYYFIDRGIYTYWQLQWKVLWFEVIFRYRDHTKKQSGRTGYWYHIFLSSTFILIISSVIELALHLRTTSWPIIFLVVFTALLLLPLLGYAIYNMSKEKYYWLNNSVERVAKIRAPHGGVDLLTDRSDKTVNAWDWYTKRI